MEHRIEIERHGTQVVVHTYLVGVMSANERDAVAHETMSVLRAAGLHKIMWDIRQAPVDYSLIKSHVAVTDMPDMGVTAEDRVAVIYAQDKEQHEHAKTVALNRGFTFVSYFEDEDEALAWLAKA